MRVRVLMGFCLGRSGDVHPGDLVELEDRFARSRIREGRAVPASLADPTLDPDSDEGETTAATSGTGAGSASAGSAAAAEPRPPRIPRGRRSVRRSEA